MKSQKISFQNRSGDELSGQIDFPLISTPQAFALFAHCFTCSKNLKSVDTICRSLTLHRIAVLRFDFTGLGMSEGDFSSTNFSSNLEDLRQAYQFLAQHYQAPQILIGHSLGGIAAIHVAKDLKAVQAVVTIGAPGTPNHVERLIKGSKAEIVKKGEAEVDIGGRNFKIRKQFLDDLKKTDSHETIRNLGKALLILHSPQDKIVDVDNAAEIYSNAMHPKSFITLDGADHLLTKEEDSEYVGLLIGPWASRYLKDPVKNQVAPEGEVWTRITDQGFITEITAGRHQLMADEPEDAGGRDYGPSPYGYLLSALGACTAMTLRMYADHKKINLKEVEVKLTHDKVHRSDGNQAEDARGKIDQIRRMIRLEGDLTEEQRKRLIEIAGRCPVHKTLEGKPEILTSEVKAV